MMEASKKVKPWRKNVEGAALECYNSGAINFPVKADIEFVFPRPNITLWIGKKCRCIERPSAPKYCISRGKWRY